MVSVMPTHVHCVMHIVLNALWLAGFVVKSNCNVTNKKKIRVGSRVGGTNASCVSYEYP